MSELYLFDVDAPKAAVADPAMALSRWRDPPTSVEAGRRFAESGEAARHRELIITALRRRGPATHAEIAQATGELDAVQVARRMKELEADGLVERRESRPCSIKATRCTVWAVRENCIRE